MRKSHIRDYATAAFQYYALTGGSDKLKKQIMAQVIEEQKKREERRQQGEVSSPTEEAINRFELKLAERVAELQDLDAVEKTIAFFESFGNHTGSSMMKALKMVYMVDPHRDPEKGEISERVHHAEINIPASERSIYGWLALARKTFAKERGLRF